jgi:two-component system, OmpR family, KDP operon response regulator KdpE
MDTSTGRVLIVEDDTALRQTLRTTLDALGFGVGEASKGEEALLQLRLNEYEAVVMDINKSGINKSGIGGMETCKRIRRTFRRLPILMLSVRDSEDDKVEALESWADDYVVKPFQTRELQRESATQYGDFARPQFPPRCRSALEISGRSRAPPRRALRF